MSSIDKTNQSLNDSGDALVWAQEVDNVNSIYQLQSKINEISIDRQKVYIAYQNLLNNHKLLKHENTLLHQKLQKLIEKLQKLEKINHTLQTQNEQFDMKKRNDEQMIIQSNVFEGNWQYEDPLKYLLLKISDQNTKQKQLNQQISILKENQSQQNFKAKSIHKRYEQKYQILINQKKNEEEISNKQHKKEIETIFEALQSSERKLIAADKNKQTMENQNTNLMKEIGQLRRQIHIYRQRELEDQDIIIQQTGVQDTEKNVTESTYNKLKQKFENLIEEQSIIAGSFNTLKQEHKQLNIKYDGLSQQCQLLRQKLTEKFEKYHPNIQPQSPLILHKDEYSSRNLEKIQKLIYQNNCLNHELSTKNTEGQQRISALEQQLQQLRTQRNKHKQLIATLINTNQSLDKQINSMIEQNNALKQQKKKIKGELYRALENGEQMTRKLQLHEKSSSLNITLEQDHIQLKIKYKQISQSNDKLSSVNMKLNEEFLASQMKLSGLKRQFGQCKVQLENLKQKNMKAQRQKEQLQKIYQQKLSKKERIIDEHGQEKQGLIKRINSIMHKASNHRNIIKQERSTQTSPVKIADTIVKNIPSTSNDKQKQLEIEATELLKKQLAVKQRSITYQQCGQMKHQPRKNFINLDRKIEEIKKFNKSIKREVLP